MAESDVIRVEFSVSKRVCRRIAGFVGGVVLATGAFVSDMHQGNKAQNEYSYAPSELADCNYSSNFKVPEDAPAYTRDKVAVLTGTLYDGMVFQDILGLRDPKKRTVIIDEAMKTLRVSTCGAYSPKVDDFGHFPLPALAEEFCAIPDGDAAADTFMASVKEAAKKEGYKEENYVSTIVMADFPACGKIGFSGRAGDGDVVTFSNSAKVLEHEIGHLGQEAAGLDAGHGHRISCADYPGEKRCAALESGDEEGAMSARGDIFPTERDAFNGYEMLLGGIIRPGQVKEITEKGDYTIDSILSDSLGTKLLAIPVPEEFRNDEFLHRSLGKLLNPQSDEELKAMIPTHFVVELSGSRRDNKGVNQPCSPDKIEYEGALCKADNEVSMKIYAVSFNKNADDELIPQPGSPTFRMANDGLVIESAILRSGHRLEHGGNFTYGKMVAFLHSMTSTPSSNVGSATITVSP